jgi:hypothetical protein
VQPFTFDQAVIAALLFVLGLFIGMFFLAGGKWKRRYRDEIARREEFERDNARLERENREYQSLRQAADRSPAGTGHTVVRDGDGVTRQTVDRDRDGEPDLVIRRP